MNPDRSLKTIASDLAHRILNALGLDLRLIKNVRAAQAQQRRERESMAWRVLEHNDFACILDIGANEGQFAAIARRVWPRARVHSFEPLPDVFHALAAKFSDDPAVTAHNIGLGNAPGVLRMHRSAFSPSSSLLPMADLHRSEWPQSVEHTDVDVHLERLDDWCRSVDLDRCCPLLIKIDVQGFELAVIDGGLDTLRMATVVVLEVSFYELYEGQPLFDRIHDRMRELGFIYRGNIEQFASKDHKRVLYADAIFENTSRTESHV